MLVLVCGLPARGKSTVARNIAKKLKAVVLNTDIIRKQLFERPTYSSEEKRLVYRAMFLIAGYLLRSGLNVVLDGTFYRRALRKRAYSLAKKTDSPLGIVLTTAPEEVVKRRMARRKQRSFSASDADFEVYKKIRDQFEPLRRPHLKLDTSLPKRENFAETDAYLKNFRAA